MERSVFISSESFTLLDFPHFQNWWNWGFDAVGVLFWVFPRSKAQKEQIIEHVHSLLWKGDSFLVAVGSSLSWAVKLVPLPIFRSFGRLLHSVVYYIRCTFSQTNTGFSNRPGASIFMVLSFVPYMSRQAWKVVWQPWSNSSMAVKSFYHWFTTYYIEEHYCCSLNC